MKVTVYSCRSFDEKELFEKYGSEMGNIRHDFVPGMGAARKSILIHCQRRVTGLQMPSMKTGMAWHCSNSV